MSASEGSNIHLSVANRLVPAFGVQYNGVSAIQRFGLAGGGGGVHCNVK